ncbi:hypothetical protein GZ998_06810 [Actinomyces sp. 594]|uniref:hypothetical protein n=1 Tax=Actinomyces sp. 594 TaxID=2057793 RepID=UPI001C564D92|nr:hypothetical protein [Actinomyces sp. 594]MBW3069212.1 hypothetical protein [Actinomyces sp. 594]
MHRSAVMSTAVSLALVFLPLHSAASAADSSTDSQLNSAQDCILAASNENAPGEELLSVESTGDSAVCIDDDVSTSLPLDPGGAFQLTAGDDQLSIRLPNESQIDAPNIVVTATRTLICKP